MRFTILLALVYSLISVSAQEAPLPPDAQKAVEQYDTEVAKLKADLDKVIDKKAVDLALKLSKCQDAATKKGDLDGALAIKNKVAVLLPKGTETGPKDASVMLGKWMMSGAGNGAAWTIKAKGQASSGEGFDGNYKVKDGKIVIEWTNGQVDSMTITDASDTTGTSGRGADLRFHRMAQ